MPYTSFTRINKEREKEGEEPFANPRNTAAGGLRQLDPALTKKRRLRMFVFAVEAIEGRLPAKHPLGGAGPPGPVGIPGRAQSQAIRNAGRSAGRNRELRGADPQAPLPGRWRGGEGGQAPAAHRAGRDRRAGAALGHRPEVRARSRRDSAARHPDQRGPHRRAQPLRRAGAGAGERGDGHQRHAAQRGADRHQGHPRGRPGRDHPGRRGDPPDRAAHHRARRRAGPASSRCRTSAPAAARRWSTPRARRCASAPTCPAPGGCWRASSTSPRATRWTSGGWATSGSGSCWTPS